MKCGTKVNLAFATTSTLELGNCYVFDFDFGPSHYTLKRERLYAISLQRNGAPGTNGLPLVAVYVLGNTSSGETAIMVLESLEE